MGRGAQKTQGLARARGEHGTPNTSASGAIWPGNLRSKDQGRWSRSRDTEKPISIENVTTALQVNNTSGDGFNLSLPEVRRPSPLAPGAPTLIEWSVLAPFLPDTAATANSVDKSAHCRTAMPLPRSAAKILHARRSTVLRVMPKKNRLTS